MLTSEAANQIFQPLPETRLVVCPHVAHSPIDINGIRISILYQLHPSAT